MGARQLYFERGIEVDMTDLMTLRDLVIAAAEKYETSPKDILNLLLQDWTLHGGTPKTKTWERQLADEFEGYFDRAFRIEIDEEKVDGEKPIDNKGNTRYYISAIGQDSGEEEMSIGDVAAFLGITRKAVREKMKSRAQSAKDPLPVNPVGRRIRPFLRTQIKAWKARQSERHANGKAKG